MKEEYREENTTSSRIEGRHSVLEALRAGSLIERLFVQKGCQDGPVLTILREAKKADVMVDFVPKERLDFMSETKITRAWLPFCPLLLIPRLMICLHSQRKKVRHRSFYTGWY